MKLCTCYELYEETTQILEYVCICLDSGWKKEKFIRVSSVEIIICFDLKALKGMVSQCCCSLTVEYHSFEHFFFCLLHYFLVHPFHYLCHIFRFYEMFQKLDEKWTFTGELQDAKKLWIYWTSMKTVIMDRSVSWLLWNGKLEVLSYLLSLFTWFDHKGHYSRSD